MQKNTAIFVCRCGAGSVSSDKTDKILDSVQKLDADVYELKDLCALSLQEKEILEEMGKKYDQKLIVACYPRAIKNMFIQNGVDFGEFEVLNLKVQSADEVFDQLTNSYQLEEGSAHYQVRESDLDVPAWYPIIDESRCTLCGQCARFCVFGVYTFEKKKSLTVSNPLSCKNNCPACGRTCPAQAIIFPRLTEKSALAGAEPGEKKPVATSNPGSLLSTLNERNRARKNIFREGVMQLAEEERKKALEEFKKGFKRED